jgi:hypothetical protein
MGSRTNFVNRPIPKSARSVGKRSEVSIRSGLPLPPGTSSPVSFPSGVQETGMLFVARTAAGASRRRQALTFERVKWTGVTRLKSRPCSRHPTLLPLPSRTVVRTPARQLCRGHASLYLSGRLWRPEVNDHLRHHRRRSLTQQEIRPPPHRRTVRGHVHHLRPRALEIQPAPASGIRKPEHVQRIPD